MNLDVAVIGAGASGMMAAIAAAYGGARVTLYEKNDRVGKKILATGNGKCNLGNKKEGISHYYSTHPELAAMILERFTVKDTITFFERMGMMIKEKNGYLYPVSEQASTVLDILRLELRRQQIKICCDSEITKVEIKHLPKLGILADGEWRMYDRVIVACGSKASLKKGNGLSGYELAEGLRHKIIPVVPALVQLGCREEYRKALAGVRCQAMLTLRIDGVCRLEEGGELQLTEYGISGIPVFQFSREAAYALNRRQAVEVWADFFPEQSEAEFDFMGRKRFANHADKVLDEFLLGLAHKKINQVIARMDGYKGTEQVSALGEKRVLEILRRYKRFVFHISSVNSFEQAQVCAGGVSLKELNGYLESVKVPGLYFVGEMVDVDGRCGGYNLQWAWASGYTAGSHAAGRSV